MLTIAGKRDDETHASILSKGRSGVIGEVYDFRLRALLPSTAPGRMDARAGFTTLITRNSRRARFLGLQRRLIWRSQVKARRAVPQLQTAQSRQERHGGMNVIRLVVAIPGN